MVDLIFRKPRQEQDAGNVVLLFGAREASTSVQPAPYSVDVQFVAIRADVQYAAGAPVSVDVQLPAFRADIQMAWDANTWRPMGAPGKSLQQEATPIAHASVARQQPAQSMISASVVRQQPAALIAHTAVIDWQDAQSVCKTAALRYQHGQRAVSMAGVLWQSASRLCKSAAVRIQRADGVLATTIWRWQSALRVANEMGVRNQHAAQSSQQLAQHIRHGQPLTRGPSLRWQEAMQAMAGRSAFPSFAQAKQPCYVPAPGDAVVLVFQDAPATGGVLLFRCRSRVPGVGKPLLVVPALEFYMHVSEIKASIWPTGEPVVLDSCTISTDEGSPAWHLNASGPVYLMEQLAPVNGLPRQIKIELNGLAWIFSVGHRKRDRQFPKYRVNFPGFSATTLLGAPWMAERTWRNSAQQMASQIMRDALDGTGVTLDWQMSDWLVPAAVWSHYGTPLSAVLKVADAVGAIVQSDRTAQTLRILPRYPAMPWEWAAAQPAVQLPIGYVKTDALEETSTPEYNMVLTSGTISGLYRKTKRAGTAGDIPAPSVADALLTESIAHAQRAKAVLGAAGKRADTTITLPLDTSAGNPGLLDINKLVEVVDTDGSWRGLVRSVSLATTRSGVMQTSKIERRAA